MPISNNMLLCFNMKYLRVHKVIFFPRFENTVNHKAGEACNGSDK